MTTEDNKVNPGHFQPIAQMRRLAMVLPISLEITDPIPVKLCLPVHAKVTTWLDSLTEKPQDASCKDKESEQETNLDAKVITKDDENIRAKGKNVSKKREDPDKGVEKSNIKTDMAGKEVEAPDTEEESLKIEILRPGNQKKVFDGQRLKSDKQTQTSSREKVDSSKQLKTSHKNASDKPVQDCHVTPNLKSLSHQLEQTESDGSESEASTAHSVATQVDCLPGRNQRAIPHSRTNSQNSDKLPVMEKYDDRPQHRRRRKDSASRSHISPFRIEKDLVDFLLQERRNEHKRDMHRHLVKRLINDEYKKKHKTNNDHSSDIEHSSYARDEHKLRPRSRLSQQDNIPVHDVGGKGKRHHSRHSSSTRLGKNYNYEEANKHLANWIKLQDARKHTDDASYPLTSNTEDAETIVMIVKEEFKRLGFL